MYVPSAFVFCSRLAFVARLCSVILAPPSALPVVSVTLPKTVAEVAVCARSGNRYPPNNNTSDKRNFVVRTAPPEFSARICTCGNPRLGVRLKPKRRLCPASPGRARAGVRLSVHFDLQLFFFAEPSVQNLKKGSY